MAIGAGAAPVAGALYVAKHTSESKDDPYGDGDGWRLGDRHCRALMAALWAKRDPDKAVPLPFCRMPGDNDRPWALR